MNISKTLLLTSTPPGDGSVGEIYLREVCRLLPKEKLACFACVSGDYFTGPLAENLKDMDIVLEKVPRETILFRPIVQRLVGKAARALYEPLHTKKVDALIQQAIAFGRQKEVQLVWSVLNSPTTIKMARKVARGLNVPLVALVWDPPEAIARDRKLDLISTRLMLDEFSKTLKSARMVACVSDPMAETYERQFGANTLVLHRVFSDNAKQFSWKPPRDRIDIVFSGSNYAPKVFAALVKALCSCDWQLKDKSVKLIMTGSNINLDVFAAGKPLNIEFLGYRSSEQMLQILAESTCAYLPYPFDASMKLQARLSFPDKLNTYVEVGCPVFFHGPSESAAADYMRKYEIGMLCHSLETNSILECVSNMVDNPDIIARFASEMERCRREELNESVCRAQLSTLLNSSHSERPASESQVSKVNG
ncbi:MAG: hypothetical protein C0507_12895 [Cyanobacteria bacterium PR.3.49]|nr:hypothetical protein [Cyanobacteria bacterium PR.3.49]